MPQLFRVASIKYEFARDIEKAVASMAEIGMTGAELRMLFGKNIIDLSDEELDRAKQICAAKGMEIMSIASPLLKCVLPGAPEVDSRFQQDMFAAKHNFEDQPRLTARAFQIAHRLGGRIVRVFSYWRSVGPGQSAALPADGYTGWVSLETHWPGPGNDKHLASMICGRNLKSLVTV